MANKLWEPNESQIKSTNMYRFMQFINARHGTDFKTYDPLYQWSVNNIADFWAALWEPGGPL